MTRLPWVRRRRTGRRSGWGTAWWLSQEAGSLLPVWFWLCTFSWLQASRFSSVPDELPASAGGLLVPADLVAIGVVGQTCRLPMMVGCVRPVRRRTRTGRVLARLGPWVGGVAVADQTAPCWFLLGDVADAVVAHVERVRVQHSARATGTSRLAWVQAVTGRRTGSGSGSGRHLGFSAPTPGPLGGRRVVLGRCCRVIYVARRCSRR